MRTGNLGKLLSIDARGSFGRSGAFGRIAFGFTWLGYYSWYAGIYQKKYYYGKPYISRQKFYRPTNPRTDKQQSWRAVCAYGWVLWNSLTDEQKKEYYEKAKVRRISGPNLFMSLWLKNPTWGFGMALFGYNANGF